MTNPNDALHIDTPENITFDYDVSGIGSRFLAALVDTALLVLAQVILYGAVLLIASVFIGGDVFRSIMERSIGGWIIALAGIISFVFF